ncbi:HAMP domain-containing protein [Aliikangiella coralliicola]|uniref:HAMP domain-containing protein n=1 Tax=Aliikangiella coralliicola TaxID=2592383 RepID=A0A545UDB4_9GAMM|nr:HAMP domain-containing protein [Aliikangiella coralliicola]TQV87459.1 HAMP domain-containing protein [Aliikangiella coralliicola]
MLTKFHSSIQNKIFSGLTLLIAVVMILVYCILESASQNQTLNNEKTHIYSLSDSLKNIQRSNTIYLSNAARDYESYFRDLDVYYKVLQQDLADIDEKITHLSQTRNILTALSQSAINFISPSNVIQLNLTIENTQNRWEQFKIELSEQFGDNKEEPRLEWGAKYISENASQLSNLFDTLISNFNTINSQQADLSKTTVNLTIATLIIFTIGFAFFFYLQIIKPVQTTKSAFQRVSEGDFGHQITSQRSDEIGQLIHSFNQMSARSESILSILSKLQSVKSSAEIVDILFSQLTTYIGCDLVVLVKKNLSNEGYRLSHVSPQANFKNLNKINIAVENQAQKEHLTKLFADGDTIQINNIDEYLKQFRNNLILQTLNSRYPLKSALVHPLDFDSQEMALVFASYHEGQLTQKHQELIKHLTPFINHKIKSMANAPAQETSKVLPTEALSLS